MVKLIIFEDAHADRLYPMTLTRPACELRCGAISLTERIERAAGLKVGGYFVRDYLAETFAQRTDGVPVNRADALKSDDLVLVNARVLALGVAIQTSGPDGAVWAAEPPAGSSHPDVGRQLAYARASAATVAPLVDLPFAKLLARLSETLPASDEDVPMADYPWNLVHYNVEALEADFKALGRSGAEGEVHEQAAIVGDASNLWIAPTAVVHPFVAIDVTGGPVMIDEDAIVHPHTRIEGPGYIGKGTMLVGGKIREGCSIGPVCRVGGEVEESIIQGYSNKYHDGFLGHAYVGEWVNLGAQTTNSDLKNDYTGVKVTVNGKVVDSEDTKVGSFIGDHTKTSIGTLFNTGTHVGAMVNCVNHGGLMPKFVPTCSLVLKGLITRGQKFGDVLTTARMATSRRKRELTEADEAMLKHVRKITRSGLIEAARRDRKKLVA